MFLPVLREVFVHGACVSVGQAVLSMGKSLWRYLAEESSLEKAALWVEIGQDLASVVAGPCCEDVHVRQGVELI